LQSQLQYRLVQQQRIVLPEIHEDGFEARLDAIHFRNGQDMEMIPFVNYYFRNIFFSRISNLYSSLMWV
jgi:hypothetical protein